MLKTSIHIDGMRLRAFHGVMPEEHVVGNEYLIDLTMDYPWAEAAASDDLTKTASYADVALIVKQEMLIDAKLLETVAQRIINTLMQRYPLATAIRLRITKLNPPMPYDCHGAGVSVEWTR